MPLWMNLKSSWPIKPWPKNNMAVEARYWHQEKDAIRCELCPHLCLIPLNQAGQCHIRVNREHHLIASMYARLTACAIDPIEKKPLFHVKPGESILSIGSAGCNFECRFCQNWNIAQMIPDTTIMTPVQVAEQAVKANCCGVAYTYNEPVINLEYVVDCAQEVKKRHLINVMVSNGYINPQPLEELIPWIDAWNIDLKSMSDSFYQEVCNGRLRPVMKSIERIAAASHVELTHLMVNDPRQNLDQIRSLIDWIVSVSPSIPLHLSRYFPQYKFQAEETDLELMQAAYRLAKEKLKWVYLGNVHFQADHTYCPNCQSLLIERYGYQVEKINLNNNRCSNCHEPIEGLF